MNKRAVGKYQAYPEYKDSGVEWLGDVPSHWSVFSGKRIFNSIRKKSLESDEQLAASQKYGVIPQSLMMKLNDSKVMLALKGIDSFRHVDNNNFVISLRSFEGGIEHSNYVGCVSPAYTVLAAIKPIAFGYYKYLLKSDPYVAALQASTDSLRDGKSISYEQFGVIDLPIAEVEEQIQIANFLDHETAKIDTLIDKQQQLIKLLKEKRQAVISHAVTKGLNPDAPMKDSGVEWLGEVPEHWDVTPLVGVADVIDPNPSHRNPKYTEDGFPFISTVEFTGIDDVQTNTPRRVAEDTVLEQEKRCDFQEGSIAFSRKGTIGAVRILPHGIRFALLDSVCVINCGKKILYDFLYQQCRSSLFESQLGAETRGAALKQVSVSRVRGVKTFVPPLSEQVTIISYLGQSLSKLDMTMNLANTQVSFLRERRTALISAAITGKIDVRNWQAPTPQDQAIEQIA